MTMTSEPVIEGVSDFVRNKEVHITESNIQLFFILYFSMC